MLAVPAAREEGEARTVRRYARRRRLHARRHGEAMTVGRPEPECGAVIVLAAIGARDAQHRPRTARGGVDGTERAMQVKIVGGDRLHADSP
jgi:hypothetical protein